MKPRVGDTVRRILLWAAVVLLPAGCSSLDNIPLSDVPIPEAAPLRVAAEAHLPNPPPPRPDHPETSVSAAAARSVPSAAVPAPDGAREAAVAERVPGPPLLDQAPAQPAPAQTASLDSSTPKPRPGTRTVDLGEAVPVPPATALPPSHVMAFADEVDGTALAGDGTLYRSGLVERRNVVGGDGTIEPAKKPEPAPHPAARVDATPVSLNQITVSRIGIPEFNARTLIWVTIGFAALIGLFLSARQMNG